MTYLLLMLFQAICIFDDGKFTCEPGPGTSWQNDHIQVDWHAPAEVRVTEIATGEETTYTNGVECECAIDVGELMMKNATPTQGFFCVFYCDCQTSPASRTEELLTDEDDYPPHHLIGEELTPPEPGIDYYYVPGSGGSYARAGRIYWTGVYSCWDRATQTFLGTAWQMGCEEMESRPFAPAAWPEEICLGETVLLGPVWVSQITVGGCTYDRIQYTEIDKETEAVLGNETRLFKA